MLTEQKWIWCPYCKRWFKTIPQTVTRCKFCGNQTDKPKGYDFDKLEKARIDQYGYIPSEAEE